VLELLRGLSREAPDGRGLDQRPFLEVRVLLDSVQPRLRAEVEAALDGAWCRLLRIETKYTGTDETLGDGVRLEHLKELDPVEVFARCYRQRFDGELPRELAAAFDELLEGAAREAGR
jgi:DNA repair protein SbcD/Mre11